MVVLSLGIGSFFNPANCPISGRLRLGLEANTVAQLKDPFIVYGASPSRSRTQRKPRVHYESSNIHHTIPDYTPPGHTLPRPTTSHHTTRHNPTLYSSIFHQNILSYAMYYSIE